VDRLAEVVDRVGRPAREALAARRVVVEVRLVGTGLDELAALSAASAYLPAS